MSGNMDEQVTDMMGYGVVPDGPPPVLILTEIASGARVRIYATPGSLEYRIPAGVFAAPLEWEPHPPIGGILIGI